MLITDKNLQSSVQGADEARTPHDTGVKLTNQSISTLTYLQEDNNDAIDTWILTMYQIAGAIVLRSPDMPVPEKYEHIEQLFSVADMFDSLKAPKGGEDEWIDY